MKTIRLVFKNLRDYTKYKSNFFLTIVSMVVISYLLLFVYNLYLNQNKKVDDWVKENENECVFDIKNKNGAIRELHQILKNRTELNSIVFISDTRDNIRVVYNFEENNEYQKTVIYKGRALNYDDFVNDRNNIVLSTAFMKKYKIGDIYKTKNGKYKVVGFSNVGTDLNIKEIYNKKNHKKFEVHIVFKDNISDNQRRNLMDSIGEITGNKVRLTNEGLSESYREDYNKNRMNLISYILVILSFVMMIIMETVSLWFIYNKDKIDVYSMCGIKKRRLINTISLQLPILYIPCCILGGILYFNMSYIVEYFVFSQLIQNDVFKLAIINIIFMIAIYLIAIIYVSAKLSQGERRK